MTDAFVNSRIYVGRVFHKRFSPKRHSFNYRLYMMALDVAELESATEGVGLFGFRFYHPLRFVEKDYVKGDPGPLSTRIKNKVDELGGNADIDRMIMLAQVRCFGIYFSPVNFYFCYDGKGDCTQMLAEVSNTPWNERHFYLVDLTVASNSNATKKVFQVSPFMDLDMSYFWRVKPPSQQDSLLVKIENQRTNNGKVKEKLFEASLVMKPTALTTANLLRVWGQLPIMTLKVVASIYWQALRLFLKRVPFLGYQKAN